MKDEYLARLLEDLAKAEDHLRSALWGGWCDKIPRVQTNVNRLHKLIKEHLTPPNLTGERE